MPATQSRLDTAYFGAHFLEFKLPEFKFPESNYPAFFCRACFVSKLTT